MEDSIQNQSLTSLIVLAKGDHHMSVNVETVDQMTRLGGSDWESQRETL